MNKINTIEYVFNNSFKEIKMYKLEVLNLKETLINILFNKRDIKQNILTENKMNEKIYKILNMIDFWENEYINNNVLDGFEAKISIIYDDNTSRVIICKNNAPNNFSDFKNLLGV